MTLNPFKKYKEYQERKKREKITKTTIGVYVVVAIGTIIKKLLGSNKQKKQQEEKQ